MNYKIQFSTSAELETFIEDANRHVSHPEYEDMFEDFKDGDKAIDTRTGTIVGRVDGKMTTLGVDEEWFHLYQRLQKAKEYKENTLAKLIERTCKADAYSSVLRYLKHHISDPAVVSNREFQRVVQHITWKRDSHRDFTSNFDVQYDYATQNFLPKEKALDPAKVDTSLEVVNDFLQGLTDDIGTDPSVQAP